MNSASSGNGSKFSTQRSKENRRKLVSLQITVAPIERGQIARLPVPADGSRTMSLGLGFSNRAATYASVGGVENCCSSVCSKVRSVCVGNRRIKGRKTE